MNVQIRGQSKKTEGWTAPKYKGGSLAVGTYLQRGSASPPPPPHTHPGRGGDLVLIMPVCVLKCEGNGFSFGFK